MVMPTFTKRKCNPIFALGTMNGYNRFLLGEYCYSSAGIDSGKSSFSVLGAFFFLSDHRRAPIKVARIGCICSKKTTFLDRFSILKKAKDIRSMRFPENRIPNRGTVTHNSYIVLYYCDSCPAFSHFSRIC